MSLADLIAKARESAPQASCAAGEYNEHLSIHVDGDYLAYFASGNDNTPAGEARQNVHSRVARLRFITGGSRVVIHMTAGDSTKGERFLIAQTQPYQDQRKGSKKPVNWQFLRDYLENYTGTDFEVKLWRNREADDGMAYFCNTFAEHRNELHVVHTRDKDMRMFAGRHVNWMDMHIITDVPLGAFDVVGEDGLQYGHKWFWVQMLEGDVADHIPCLNKVGEKTAMKILEGCKDNERACQLVSGEYRQRLGDAWPDYFVEMAALLWMRTDRDASVTDFLKLGCFGTLVEGAASRMKERVMLQRQTLEALKQ